MPWSGFCHTLVAPSACDSTIGHSRRGNRWLCRVCSRIESSTAPKTSFCFWSNAPLPIRTGLRALVAGQLVAGRLGQVTAAVDAVHDLQRAVLGRLDVGDELHEVVGFPVQQQVVQRPQGEGRVPHPGVAVVPVAFAARRLRQRGRQRGDGGAGRHVGQPLDGQRRALQRFPPPVVGHPRVGQPVAPEVDGRVDPVRSRVVDVGRDCEAVGPGQRAERTLALAAARAVPAAGCPRRRRRDRCAAVRSRRRRWRPRCAGRRR